MHYVRYIKSSASESKQLQSRSKGEIPGRARQKEQLSLSKLKQAFLINSDAELIMYLIQCIRFGSWKVRRLSRALDVLEVHVFKWKLFRLDFQSSGVLVQHDVGTLMRLYKQ